jgi:hypothetical protein
MGLHRISKALVDSLPGPVAEWVLQGIRLVRSPIIRSRHRERRRFMSILGRPNRVLSGSFEGMAYRGSPLIHDVLPKVLGTYEMELRPVVERVREEPPDAIINIGASDGYYAAGLGRLASRAKLVCFEIHKPTKHLLKRTLRANGFMERAELHDAGTPETLNQALRAATHPLVVCDCEGYEDVVLDPARVAGLRRASVLVELHEPFKPGVTARLRERFAPTHDIRYIEAQARTDADAPPVKNLDSEAAAGCMDEFRAFPGAWYFMEPKPER